MAPIHHELVQHIATYGYWAVGLVVGLECIGLPLPGETALLGAAIYAGTTHHLSILGIIAAASAGSIVGGTVGFILGHDLAYRLLLRYGSYIRLTERRIKLGQYLFMRHGSYLVFFSRFIALIRGLGVILAGVNRMDWRRFMIFNITGSIAWATLYGGAAYMFGHRVKHLLGPVALGLGIVIVGLVVWGTILLHRHAARLEDEAERALPGKLHISHARH